MSARSATLSPKISGYVVDVAVEDNAQVKAGDVIARIDDGDYRLAVQIAQDQVAVQQATVERLGKQAVAQEAAVEQAKAQLVSAKAGQTRAELELKRKQELATREISSRQSLEQAQANYEQAVASVQATQAAVEAASANVDVLKAQQEEAQRTLRQLKTSLAKAERDLSFTVIRAPFDGVIGNRAMQVGDYVQPTQRLASLVPLEAVYIDANFKRRSSPACGRDSPSPSPSMPYRASSSRGVLRVSRRPLAPCSRCCRPTTPPAISPRSCNGCRCASSSQPRSWSNRCCALALLMRRPAAAVAGAGH